MNKLYSSIFAFSLPLSVGMLATSPAISAVPTPDGVTPAHEMVCDPLKADGTTKGLYGLCVAYCEATDSPDDLSTEEKIASLPTQSRRILGNYNKKRAVTDPQMPCATFFAASNCPAWTAAQLAAIGASGYPYRVDDEEYNGVAWGSLYDLESGTVGDIYGINYVQVYYAYGDRVAYHINAVYNYTANAWTTYEYNRVPNLSQAEYDGCALDIRNHVM